MPNYTNGKIYRINVDGSDLVYYGSTTDPLYKRMSSHKASFMKSDHHRSVNELFKFGDPYITLVEKYPCDTKEELHARERWYIENNNCVNKVVPKRTKKEYYHDTKDHLNEIRREQYKNDEKRNIIIARNKEWRDRNKEALKAARQITTECGCGGSFNSVHKRRHERTQKHQEWLATQSTPTC